jgi:hypothetical protein
VPHSKAEHMAAPTNAANVKKALANSAPSTHGPRRTFLNWRSMSAFGGKARTCRNQSKMSAYDPKRTFNCIGPITFSVVFCRSVVPTKSEAWECNGTSSSHFSSASRSPGQLPRKRSKPADTAGWRTDTLRKRTESFGASRFSGFQTVPSRPRRPPPRWLVLEELPPALR